MNPTCHQFRDAALEWLGASQLDALVSKHAANCEACAAWLERARNHVRAFRELTPREAPAELFQHVAEGLRFDSDGRIQRIVSTLRSLEGSSATGSGSETVARIEAPSELDERVFADLAKIAQGTPVESVGDQDSLGVQALRTLTSHPAPRVLERLVSEELEKPAYHRVNRFTDLEKMGAPDALGDELEKTLQPSLLRRRVGSLIGSLAAAGLVFWLAIGSFPGTPGAGTPGAGTPGAGPRFETRPFEVVSSESADELHPWLQSGIGILAGPRPATASGKEAR